MNIPVPRVPIVTVTDGLHGLVIKVASLGVAVAAGSGAGAQTLSAGNLVLTKLRCSIVANLHNDDNIISHVVPTIKYEITNTRY